MSPEAIHSLIELFGVEKGLHILNLFTAPEDADVFRNGQKPQQAQKGAQEVLQKVAPLQEAAANSR